MSEIWKNLLKEIEVGQLPQGIEWMMYSADRYPIGKKVRLYLEEQPIETAQIYMEEFVQHCQNVVGIVENTFFSVLTSLLYNLTAGYRFVLVRVCIKHLTETAHSSPIPKGGVEKLPWADLWCVLATNKIAINNAVQLRQLRMVMRKVNTIHPDNLQFAYEQLVFIADRMNMNRMERYKWFREVRKPKWLDS
jgi:hypothetical protein